MERIISLAGGRKLHLEVEGADHGEVVLVHNGTPNSRLLFPAHVVDAEARGIRLVGYDRPGYGGSSRQIGRSVSDAVDDARAIAAALGVDRMLTWGISGGGPHALACAALAPDLIVAAASLASLAPYGAPGLDFFSGMGELNVEDFQLLINDPPAFEAKASAERDELLQATPEGLLEQWGSLLSDVDAGAATGDLAEYLIDAMQSGLAPGPGGYIDDSFAFVRPWGFEPSDIKVPVLLWQGREDRFVPFGHGEWLAAQIPGVEAHLSDNDGHVTLMQKVGDIHDWLVRHLR
ncbi:MAG: alpha/beta fold hydrolase [Acidimicrobiales bacterium]|jgi:pimeloyl-ACP methyl ester carboxylesterase